MLDPSWKLAKNRGNIDDRIRLSWWFPKLPSDIPVPKTRIIPYFGDNLLNLLDGGTPRGFISLCKQIVNVGKQFGWPLFLRTDYLSGKHGWNNTCYIPSPHNIAYHIFKLVEESINADLLGFPTDCWVVRELIPTLTSFKAFYGYMPIIKERRYFVHDARVICHHPYWPPEAFEGKHVRVSVSNWREYLDVLNIESEDEVRLLSELSSRVGATIGGAWSIDWLWSEQKSKWFLIDMADAAQSYHWPGCRARK